VVVHVGLVVLADVLLPVVLRDGVQLVVRLLVTGVTVPDDERVPVTVVLRVSEALGVGETLIVAAATGKPLLDGDPDKVMLADDDGQRARVELPLHELRCPGPPKKQCSQQAAVSTRKAGPFGGPSSPITIGQGAGHAEPSGQ